MSEQQAEVNFKKQLIKDNLKNIFCKENNIILLRISYLNFKDIDNIL
jgi:hypothetical protein